IDTVKREIRKRVGFPSRPRDVLTFGDKVFITGGLSDLYTLKGNLDGGMQRVTLEAGPGPMVAREGRLYVANGLSSSITILKTKNLEEEISILVGVLLGRMVYKDRRIVVNNCFRDNVMVLNPDDFMIEEIVPAGGAMEYSPQGENFVMFDDSMAVSMGRMPSKVALNEITDLPRGVKLFAPTGNPDVFLVLDQDRYICRVNLKQRFRRGMIPLPDECRGLFTFGKRAWVLGTHELYSFPVDETVGLTHTYSARPFKISPPYVATDGFSRDRGSELKLISRDRLGDVFTTRGEIRLLRQDPDTTYTWIGTSREVYIFNNKTSRQRSLVSVTEEVREIYLPPGSIHGYIATRDKTYIVDRETLFRRDEIDVGGDFIYASGDELFLRDPYDPRRMIVADGYRGSLFQELTLPLVPTDAASDGDRLFLLGGAQGAIAVYVNRINTARLPRRLDRRVWDTDADRRSGTHR
ncbi:MAG: hypothetical protein U9N45_00920, partial [Gemmatimonadota bacterium]|nr:hypothetical protein [Gemmatimonadota bacterium]